jgi:hypothetical protein
MPTISALVAVITSIEVFIQNGNGRSVISRQSSVVSGSRFAED